MMFMVLLTLTLAAVVVATAWSALKDVRDPAPKSADAPRPAAPESPESLEGVLVRQVLEGEITRAQYRRAVQKLAERDADRHPLSVPPED